MSASDYTICFSRIVRKCQPDSVPTLTKGDGITPSPGFEIDDIIIACQRAVVWSTGLTLRKGQRVFPTTRNGQIYEVVIGGITGQSEPAWSDGLALVGGLYDYNQPAIYDNTVQYISAGEDFIGLYDVREALRQCCELKAAKAAASPDYSADGVSIKNSQVVQYWTKEAEKFDAVGIG